LHILRRELGELVVADRWRDMEPGTLDVAARRAVPAIRGDDVGEPSLEKLLNRLPLDLHRQPAARGMQCLGELLGDVGAGFAVEVLSAAFAVLPARSMTATQISSLRG
jgi:hypothetical protein